MCFPIFETTADMRFSNDEKKVHDSAWCSVYIYISTTKTIMQKEKELNNDYSLEFDDY
jgi:hypothetical protein